MPIIKGTRTNGINKYILSTIGVPKIIGSLMLKILGTMDNLPKLRNDFYLAKNVI